jgi:hypothetical protein
MTLVASSQVSHSTNSFETGMELGREIRARFESAPLKGVFAYSTVNHDQTALVQGVREICGGGVPIIGCSAQGVMWRDDVKEEGYVAGAMGLGGASLDLVTAKAEDFHVDSADKGRALGRALHDAAREPLKVVVLHYDPLCGADVDVFLRALHAEVNCPIVGGAAAEFWGPMQQTFQYAEDKALQKAAVAAGLYGAFTAATDICHGTSPIGIDMTVTKSTGTMVLEFDGRPALDVWQEFCSEAPQSIEHSGAIGIGLPTKNPGEYLVRCAFGVDEQLKGVVFQAAIPAGSRVLFNHRTVQGAVDGTKTMALRLRERLHGKAIRAVLGFECGARTLPFLGKDQTRAENIELQNALAPSAAWLGMLAWGEVSLFAGEPGFVNFSFPVLVLADP